MNADRTQSGAEASRAQALRDTLAAQFVSSQAEALRSPGANPAERMAADLARRIDMGTLAIDELEDLIHLLTVHSFAFRARRLAVYFGECDPAREADTLRDLVRRLARDSLGERCPFEAFRTLVERDVLGIVITGHPTFGMSAELTALLAALGPEGGEPTRLSPEAHRALLERVGGLPHGPPTDQGLRAERRFAAAVVANIQSAIARVYRIVLSVAREFYPDRWHEIVPALLTVASWVGYDTDGRADIHWNDIVAARLQDTSTQLSRYAAALEGVPGDAFAALRYDLAALAADTLAERDLVPATPGDVEQTRAFNRHLVETRGGRPADIAGLTGWLSAAIAAASGEDARLALAVLRAEMANYGTSGAHLHVRINAVQLTNAIRKEVGIESAPDEAADRRRYLRALNDLLDQVKPVSVNFGSILTEPMSARRIFMVLAQLLKHVDSGAPVRFLIAESDTTFTVLSALYLARLFGIAQRIDISPLFETLKGLEHGHEVADELLKNPHFRAYVRARGRFCIETGFSDAGRYLGQPAASLAIERLRIKMVEVLARHGLQDAVTFVVFDTHGESIGRGAHPVSFEERLDYVYTPAARHVCRAAKVAAKHEISFQGGDGFVYFVHPDLTFATVSRLLCHALSADAACAEDIRERDLFYADSDYSLDFFLTIKGFNERVVADPDYATLLLGAGRNLLYRTGSRHVSREGAGAHPLQDRRVTQMRAIPHNGVLQQLGYLANSVGGIGRAIAKDPDRFAEILAGSPRCRGIMALSAYAFTLGSPDAFAAYARLFDPGAWLARARRESDPGHRHALQRISRRIAATDWHEGPARAARVLLDDALDFSSALDELTDAHLVPAQARDCHPDLDLLHVVRLALIQQIFLLAARLPRFTPQEDITVDEVIERILTLDVPGAVTALKLAFPVAGPPARAESFGEPASYQVAGARSYDEENRRLFDPMLRLDGLVRAVSVCISHVMGSVG